MLTMVCHEREIKSSWSHPPLIAIHEALHWECAKHSRRSTGRNGTMSRGQSSPICFNTCVNRLLSWGLGHTWVHTLSMEFGIVETFSQLAQNGWVYVSPFSLCSYESTPCMNHFNNLVYWFLLVARWACQPLDNPPGFTWILNRSPAS